LTLIWPFGARLAASLIYAYLRNLNQAMQAIMRLKAEMKVKPGRSV